jgi:hypothetical protein
MRGFSAQTGFEISSSSPGKRWSVAVGNLAECMSAALDQAAELNESSVMKTKRRLLTREELLAFEERHPCVLGNLLSLGAAHFRQTNRKNGRQAHRNGTARHRRKGSGSVR